MGITKSSSFTTQQNETALLLKAIAHPARIAIVEYLLKVQSCICGDIVSELPLAQATISQHLKELKNAGIIKGNIEGTTICYCLENEVVEKLAQYFSEIAKQINHQKSSCC